MHLSTSSEEKEEAGPLYDVKSHMEGKDSWEVPMDEGENVGEYQRKIPDQNNVSCLAMLGDSRSLPPPHESFTSATPIEEEERDTLFSPHPLSLSCCIGSLCRVFI